MIKRHLDSICFDPSIGRQMRFVTGPRQSGKTTLARHLLSRGNYQNLYFNWDLREVRDMYKSDYTFFESALREAQSPGRLPWVCFDEIHKMPKWKNILKGYYDKYENDCRFIVTGSARLDWFRRSGDSLAGRYFLFRLNPLTLSEAAGHPHLEPERDEGALEFIVRKLSRGLSRQDLVAHLLNYSGFPEPFLKADETFYRRWQRDMVDFLTREDVRDLTRIMAVEHIATLMQIMPDRVGSPLSLNALTEDIEASYTAVKNGVVAMQLICAVFLIPPYHQRIARAVKKEKKAYFFDWGRVLDPAKRFENYVAVELAAMIDLWHDSGIADFDLMYVRTRDGRETDFLILRNRQPWCLIEAKLQDEVIARHHFDQANTLGNIPFIQVTGQDKVYKKQDSRFFRISAGRFFA
jgi:predicted AAA+ superfamily ATPase